MWIVRFGALLVAAGVQGCGVELTAFGGPGPDRSVTELRGREIAPASQHGVVRWSPKGDRVTFISPGDRTAVVHDVATGVTEALFTIESGMVHDVQYSADGLAYFTSSTEAEGKFLREHSATGTIVHTAGAVTGHVEYPTWRQGMLVAQAEAAAAFLVSPDLLFLARRGQPPLLVGPGCFGILALSPDETRVLCAKGLTHAEGVAIFPVNGGPIEPIALPIPMELLGQPAQVHWGVGGIRMLYYASCCWNLVLSDQAGGTTRAIARLDREYAKISWSADGRKAVYVESYCAQSDFLSCARSQGFLQLLDLASATIRRVAVHTFPAHDRRHLLAISPTGSTVAYVIGSRLYLLDIT